MEKANKTKYQLLNELFELSQRVAEFERLEAERKLADEILSESERRCHRMVDAVTPLYICEWHEVWKRKPIFLMRKWQKIASSDQTTGMQDSHRKKAISPFHITRGTSSP